METLRNQNETIQSYQLVEFEPNPELLELVELQRLKQISELEAPARMVGDLALAAIMAGAMAHANVLPAREVLTSDLLVGTSNLAERHTN